MDKKTFAKTITQVLRDYGFVNSGSCHFYLNLERVVVWVERIPAPDNPGAKSFLYACCFKDIHPDLDFSNMNINDYKDLPWDVRLWRYIDSPEILYFNDRPYHKEFDPFKTDFENYVRDNFAPKIYGMRASAYDEFKRRGLIF